jgi:hypothetical protein
MTRALSAPLAPFVDALPTPSRIIAAERDGRLTVRMFPDCYERLERMEREAERDWAARS